MNCNQPIFFEKNRVFRVYTGGTLLDQFVGTVPGNGDGFYPEEWIASAVEAKNEGSTVYKEGISKIKDTDLYLDDLIKDHKQEILGDRDEMGVLVKFLDSAVRLPIQAHPDKAFSRQYFHSDHGKEECWIVLATRPGGHVYFGFREGVTAEEFNAAIDRSETDKRAMEPLLVKYDVEPGDVILVPAKCVHAIGEGCLILEVQEPTDFTIQPEHYCCDYKLSDREMYLGLSRADALKCFDYTPVSRVKRVPCILFDSGKLKKEELIGEQSENFSINRYKVSGGAVSTDMPCSVWIVTEGKGKISGQNYEKELTQGDYFLLPAAAAGRFSVSGELTIVECFGKTETPITRHTDIGNTRKKTAFLPTDLCGGKTYFVSASEGDDQNDGLSPATAFRSVEKVNQLSLSPGDSILFRRGDCFLGVHLAPKGSGDPKRGKWITIDAYGEGKDPLFKDASQNMPAISLQDKSIRGGYRIRHLQIENYLLGIVALRPYPAIALESLAISHCTLRHITTGRDFDPKAELPCGSPLAFGMWLSGVRDLYVSHLTIDDTDSPFQFCGGHALFEKMLITRSHIQGMMIYGIRDRDRYEEIMAADGYVTVRDSKILYTGDKAAPFGSTGCLLENIHHATVKNTEVAYTVNTLGAFDACAVDWEQSNIDCTFESIYAHDNQGPFVLAMEHPESAGNSRGNVIRGCLSVNNGCFGGAETNSFINYSSYNEAHQKIRIENCTDLAPKGVKAYAETSKEEAAFSDGGRKQFPLLLENFKAGQMDLCERFEKDSLEGFAEVEKAHLHGGALWLEPGGKAVPHFSAKNYVHSLWVKGDVAIGFGGKYLWQYHRGTLTAAEADSLLQTYPNTLESPEDWQNLRMEIADNRIDTYLGGKYLGCLPSEVSESKICLTSRGSGAVRDLQIYRKEPSKTAPASYEAENKHPSGDFGMTAAGGEFAFFSPEVNWKSVNMKSWQYRPFRTG